MKPMWIAFLPVVLVGLLISSEAEAQYDRINFTKEEAEFLADLMEMRGQLEALKGILKIKNLEDIPKKRAEVPAFLLKQGFEVLDLPSIEGLLEKQLETFKNQATSARITNFINMYYVAKNGPRKNLPFFEALKKAYTTVVESKKK